MFSINHRSKLCLTMIFIDMSKHAEVDTLNVEKAQITSFSDTLNLYEQTRLELYYESSTAYQ